MAPLVPDTDAPLPTDSIPDDHEFVCLTLGPSVFGAPDDRPPFRLDTARIHFRSPVAVGDHWPRLIGTVSLDKLYRTRLAFVASDSNGRRTGSETAGEAIARFEHRAYTALRASSSRVTRLRTLSPVWRSEEFSTRAAFEKSRR